MYKYTKLTKTLTNYIRGCDMKYHLPFKKKYKLTSPYGWRIHPITKKKQMHNGCDWATPMETPLYPMAMGCVIGVGKNTLSGNYIRIEHGDGLVTAYAHLKEVLVKVGECIDTNQVVAKSGMSGRVTGPCLHVTVWTSRELLNTIDPMTIIANG